MKTRILIWTLIGFVTGYSYTVLSIAMPTVLTNNNQLLREALQKYLVPNLDATNALQVMVGVGIMFFVLAVIVECLFPILFKKISGKVSKKK